MAAPGSPTNKGQKCHTVKVEILGSVIFSVNGEKHRSVRRIFGITYSGLLGVRLLECTRGNYTSMYVNIQSRSRW